LFREQNSVSDISAISFPIRSEKKRKTIIKRLFSRNMYGCMVVTQTQMGKCYLLNILMALPIVHRNTISYECNFLTSSNAPG
jgi:hypothetical protein